jgi:Ni/Fe-hydrogenase subunit HybB-like protein
VKTFFNKITPFHVWTAGLSAVIITGAICGVLILINGLGITNLTDLVPWGFIGMIGYSMAMLCLFMDIGRPDRFWHAFVFWNTHSVLWEVTMCVGLYFAVLVLETLPIIGGVDWVKSHFPKTAKRFSKIHQFAPYLAIAGLFLSMLHQSSLGATYGVLKARPLWYSPSLSTLFMFSAIVGGISLTVLASMLAAYFSKKANINDRILEKLSHFIGWGLVGYLYFRFWYTFSMT